MNEAAIQPEEPWGDVVEFICKQWLHLTKITMVTKQIIIKIRPMILELANNIYVIWTNPLQNQTQKECECLDLHQ